METLPPDSILECQICFNYYSPRRRPKLLDCHHTCCSVCLTQMRSGAREVRCPWCRRITRLPAGLTSVSQLPDDPDLVAVVAIPHASEHTPVFIRLPSNGCYMLPLPMAKERALLPGQLGCRLLPGGAPGLGAIGSGKGGGGGMAVLAIPEQERLGQLGLGSLEGLDGLEEAERRGGAMGGGGGGGGGGGMGGGKGSTWSGVCTVILVACVLLFLLGIVLHNMSCISKRFTVISCG